MIPKILENPNGWRRVEPHEGLSGINPAWESNGHLIKMVTPAAQEVSGVHPKIEAVHPRILRTLGVAHHLVHYFEHKGNHFIHAPLETGWVSLDHARPSDIALFDPKHVAKILTAEHALGIKDRHGGNYVIKPGSTQPVPIDTGVVGRGSGVEWSQLYHAMKSKDRAFHKHPVDREVIEGLQKYAGLDTPHRIRELRNLPKDATIGDLV